MFSEPPPPCLSTPYPRVLILPVSVKQAGVSLSHGWYEKHCIQLVCIDLSSVWLSGLQAPQANGIHSTLPSNLMIREATVSIPQRKQVHLLEGRELPCLATVQ